MKHRLELYMDEGVMDVHALGRRLWALVTAWQATEPRAHGWSYEVEGGARRVTSSDDCAAALRANAYTWHVGETARESYEVTLFVGAAEAPLTSVTYTCGIGPIDIEGIFAPSRLVGIVDESLSRDGGPALLQTWMLKAIEIMRPRFGHAGSLDVPRSAKPLSRAPKPPVGWLTYLSQVAGDIPTRLPPPSVAYAAPDGLLLVAHPELFLEYKSAHRDAVEALHDALDAAGVLARAAWR